MTIGKTVVSAPLGVAGEYPSHDNSLGKGGFHIVSSVSDRDAIWELLKDETMVVHVLNGDSGSPETYKWDVNSSKFAPHSLEKSPVIFVNPDGSKHVVEELELSGMKVIPATGNEPAKLIALSKPGIPNQSDTEVYAFFATTDELADDFDLAGVASLAVTHEVTVTKVGESGEYLFLVFPPGHGDDITRVSEGVGLPALWNKTTKDFTVNNAQGNYTIMRSPSEFHESSVTLTLYN